MFERGGAGGRDHAAQIARLVELAKQFPNRQEPAWRESHIRQQLAQLAIEAKALQVTRLRGLTRRLRGEPPGPEGSILKLFGSELATAHRRFLGDPARPLRDASTRRPRPCPTRRAGHTACSAPGNTRSPAAPARSSATSSASACSACRGAKLAWPLHPSVPAKAGTHSRPSAPSETIGMSVVPSYRAATERVDPGFRRDCESARSWQPAGGVRIAGDRSGAAAVGRSTRTRSGAPFSRTISSSSRASR